MPYDFAPGRSAVYPPPNDTYRRLTPTEPSWLVWWEANRDPYLQTLRKRHGLHGDAKASDQSRKQAVAALLAALKSESLAVRGSAALALGQIGDEAALPALARLTGDEEVRVRQAAILAIGLLDTPRGEKVLTAIAFKPVPQASNGFADQPSDRQAALLALGLMDRPSAETVGKLQKLFHNKPLTMTPLSAWSLTRPLDPADKAAPRYSDWNGNQKGSLAAGSLLATAAITLETLSHQDDPAVAKLCRDVLGKTNSPWLASQALLAMGRRGGPEAVGGLAEILLATPKGKALPAYKMLDEQNKRLTALWQVRRSDAVCKDTYHLEWTGLGPAAYGQAVRAAYWGSGRSGGYLQLHFGGENCDPVRVIPNHGQSPFVYDFSWLGVIPAGNVSSLTGVVARVNLGVEPIQMANLRASAAIALGQIDTPASRAALRRVLAETIDPKVEKAQKERKKDKKYLKDFDDFDYRAIYKSAAIMSLGQLGDVDALPALAEWINPQTPRGHALTKEQIHDPLRGFAALALGLYARSVETDDGVKDRKDFDKACQALARRMADRDEPQEFRAACALALGLSGRAENLAALQAVEKTIDKADDLLIGYVLLARGMLEDETILAPARAFLSAQNNRTDREGILGRRAAVLGVGLIGSQEAAESLADAWGLAYHVARETAFAATFCHAHDEAAAKLLAALTNDDLAPEHQAQAGRCLGDLFTKTRPSRLAASLITQHNHDMRIPRLTFYRSIANEFLFTYLLAPTDDEWETLRPLYER